MLSSWTDVNFDENGPLFEIPFICELAMNIYNWNLTIYLLIEAALLESEAVRHDCECACCLQEIVLQNSLRLLIDRVFELLIFLEVLNSSVGVDFCRPRQIFCDAGGFFGAGG